MSAISFKYGEMQLTFYPKKSLPEQLSPNVFVQAQQSSKKLIKSMSIQKLISNQHKFKDKTYKPMLFENSHQAINSIDLGPLQKRQTFQFSFGQNLKGQKEDINESDEFSKQIKTASFYDSFCKKHQNIQQEFGIDDLSSLNKRENIIQINEPKCEPYQKQHQSRFIRNENQSVNKQIQKQIHATQQKDQEQQYFFEQKAILQQALRFNFQVKKQNKKKRGFSKKTQNFLKFTLNEDIINLSRYILQNNKNLDEKFLKKYKHNYNVQEDCFIFIAFKSLYKRYKICQIQEIVSQILKRSFKSVKQKFYRLSLLNQKQIIQKLRDHIQGDDFYQNLTIEKDKKFFGQNNLKLGIIKLDESFKIDNGTIYDLLSQQNNEKVNQQIKKTQLFRQEETVNQQQSNQQKIIEFNQTRVQHEKMQNFNNYQQIKNKDNDIQVQDKNKIIQKQYDKKQTENYSFGDVKHQNLQQTKKQIKIDKIRYKQNEQLLRKQLNNSQWSSQFELLAQANFKKCTKQMKIKFEIDLNNQVQQTLASQKQCEKSDDDLQKVIKFYVVKKESYQPKLKPEKILNQEKVTNTNSTVQTVKIQNFKQND